MDEAIGSYKVAQRRLAEGRLEEAVELLEKAVLQSRGHPRLLYELASALHRAGRHWEALGYMKSSVKASLAGQNLAGLAVLLLRDGKVDEAVEAAQRAVDLDPDLPAARVVLADALVEAGRSNDAGPHSQRARELDPNALDAYAMTRANRLQFMGRMREA